MKYFILTLAVVLLVSCGARNPQVTKSEEKKNPLVEYLQKYKDAEYKTGNAIQRDELWQEREDGLVLLQDSVGVFCNLRGHINRIKARDVKDSKVVEFSIEIEPEKYFKITLECSHFVDEDSLGTDSLYQIVKGLSDQSIVYVDGAVAVTSEGKAANSSWGDKDLQFSYPEYKFNVVTLSTQPLPEVSANVKNAIVIWRRSFESILRNEESAVMDENIAAFKKATESLTPDEDAYMAKYVNACSIDLYRN